jgi:glycosyltransferase involved in cell wall biosynthesis
MAVPLWTRRPVVGMVQWLHAREKARQYKMPFGLLERLGVRTHRRLIAVSQDTASRLSTMNPRAHVTVIGNGIDAGLLELTPRLGHDILFLGRLELDGKGLDLLLQAWAVASRRLPAQLVVAGSGPDDVRARRLAQQLGVADRVRFVGWVSGAEKTRLLNESRLLVLPSRAETFGLVALEALAAATPVLAFDLPALREVVPPGAGWLVTSFDVSALADRLAAVYDDDEAMLAAGRRGRAFAQGFDWADLAHDQALAYRAAVDEDRARGKTSSALLALRGRGA